MDNDTIKHDITVVEEDVEKIQTQGRKTANSTWIQGITRVGYAAKGVVFLIVGGLAVKLAIGVSGGAAASRRAALLDLYHQPLGELLLIIIAIGIFIYSLWAFAQAIFDTEHWGHTIKGILIRISYAILGISYMALAIGAYQIVDKGSSSTEPARDWSIILLKLPLGVAIVFIVGLVFIVIGGYLFFKAGAATFRKQLDMARLNAIGEKVIIFIGSFGFASLAVVFLIIGLFFIVAAVAFNPNQAKGLGTSLQLLLVLPLGGVLLAIIALGIISYGFYCFVEIFYRLTGKGG